MRDKILCNIKDELKAKIAAIFINLKKRTVRMAGRRFQNHLESMVETNGNFFE